MGIELVRNFLFGPEPDYLYLEDNWHASLNEILRNWEQEAERYSHEEQNRAIWRIIGEPIFIGFDIQKGWDMVWDDRVALLEAGEFVTLAIPKLFAPGEPMENGYFMWWDCMLEGLEEPKLADVALVSLTKLVWHLDDRVQYAALHGLGHLQHDQRPDVVDSWIQLHPDLADDPWVLQCREGTVM